MLTESSLKKHKLTKIGVQRIFEKLGIKCSWPTTLKRFKDQKWTDEQTNVLRQLSAWEEPDTEVSERVLRLAARKGRSGGRIKRTVDEVIKPKPKRRNVDEMDLPAEAYPDPHGEDSEFSEEVKIRINISRDETN